VSPKSAEPRLAALSWARFLAAAGERRSVVPSVLPAVQQPQYPGKPNQRNYHPDLCSPFVYHDQ